MNESAAPTVVVVEDNPSNMRMLEQTLSLHGYRTVISCDGSDLVEQVVASDARLILMDIQLPKQSGIDLLKALKADARTAALPVVAVTAFADTDSVALFHREGFDQVITKPLSIRHLLGEVGRYCGVPCPQD